MKRRFMAILLVGGLTLGLWGCGGSSDSALPDPATEAQITGSAAYSTEEVLPEVWYTADDLLEMWDAGTLSKENADKENSNVAVCNIKRIATFLWKNRWLCGNI